MARNNHERQLHTGHSPRRLTRWGGAALGIAGITAAGWGLFGHNNNATRSHLGRDASAAAPVTPGQALASQKSRAAESAVANLSKTQARAQQIAGTAANRILKMVSSNKDAISYDNGRAVGVFPGGFEATEIFANTSGKNDRQLTIDAINMPKGANKDSINDVQVRFQLSPTAAKALNRTAARRAITANDFLGLSLENPVNAQLEQITVTPNSGVRREEAVTTDAAGGIQLSWPNTFVDKPGDFGAVAQPIEQPSELNQFAERVDSTLNALQRNS